MKIGTLIIFSGLPGTGKSTLALKLSEHLSATYLRIDTIEQGLREICGISELQAEGYQLAHRIARDNLKLGNIVVADSVNPIQISRDEWNSIATTSQAKFINVEIICSNKQEHQERVENREVSVVGLKRPTWNDVLNREYQPWTNKIVQIDTSGKAINKTLEELIIALKAHGLAK